MPSGRGVGGGVPRQDGGLKIVFDSLYDVFADLLVFPFCFPSGPGVFDRVLEFILPEIDYTSTGVT